MPLCATLFCFDVAKNLALRRTQFFPVSGREQTIDRRAGLRQSVGMERKTKPRVKRMDPKVLLAYDRWVAKNLDEMSQKYRQAWLDHVRQCSPTN